MFESHKLSEVVSALLPGLFSNPRSSPGSSRASAVRGGRLEICGRGGPAPTPRDLRARAWGAAGGGALRRVGRPGARGFPFSLGDLVVSREVGFTVCGVDSPAWGSARGGTAAFCPADVGVWAAGGGLPAGRGWRWGAVTGVARLRGFSSSAQRGGGGGAFILPGSAGGGKEEVDPI